MNTKLETSMSILSQYLNEFEDRLKEDRDTSYLQILIVKQARKVKQYYYKQEQNTIQVDVMYYHTDDAETIKVYDVEEMREEFELQLTQLTNK